MKKYVVGMDAPVLASVKVAKNAPLAAEIKYINFGIQGSKGSSKFYKHLI